MNLMPIPRNKPLLLLTVAMLAFACTGAAQDKPAAAPNAPEAAVSAGPSGQAFSDLADQALQAMRERAETLKIKGVAVVAYVPGDDVKAWSSKMLVVGQLTSQSSTNDPGSNLLGIACSKAAEMATTLKPSGNAGRRKMTGETGFQGGWIAKGKNGWLIGAFSGGRSDQDLQVSKTGVAVLAGAL
jgi:uncharacterized protein GlcG (DUF336 family)